MDQARTLVNRAIRAAVPPGHTVERKLATDSTLGWTEPTPAAGLTAALAVIDMAQRTAYTYVLGLRGEGTSWQQVADLLNIPWSDHYSRTERAYDLVLGPDPDPDRVTFRNRNLYWSCAGPGGCGAFITDRGPFNGHPADNEDGHRDGCLRHAAEGDAYEQECDQRDEQARIRDLAMDTIRDSFGQDTVLRARWVLAHGGQYQGWSTSETLAVALVLRHDDKLREHGFQTRAAAAERVFAGMGNPPGDRARWLATVRAAATGDATGWRRYGPKTA
jgi:hypothetical protein